MAEDEPEIDTALRYYLQAYALAGSGGVISGSVIADPNANLQLLAAVAIAVRDVVMKHEPKNRPELAAQLKLQLRPAP